MKLSYNTFSGLRAAGLISEAWSLTPLHNPEKLRLMRYAYQLLLNSDLVHYDDGEQKLRAFLGDEEFATAIPKGWFCVGKKHDVPRNARYCGSYHDVYVWVMDDRLDGLSRFYLTILRIALLEANQRTAEVTRTYEGAPSGGKSENDRSAVRRAVADQERAHTSHRGGRVRRAGSRPAIRTDGPR